MGFVFKLYGNMHVVNGRISGGLSHLTPHPHSLWYQWDQCSVANETNCFLHKHFLLVLILKFTLKNFLNVLAVFSRQQAQNIFREKKWQLTIPSIPSFWEVISSGIVGISYFRIYSSNCAHKVIHTSFCP